MCNGTVDSGIDFLFRQPSVFTSECKFSGGIDIVKLGSGILENGAYDECGIIKFTILNTVAVNEDITAECSGIEVRNQTVYKSQYRCLSAP